LSLFQHFAVVLGTQLVSVPFIDYTQNPFGIPAGSGADIQGNFTRRDARDLVRILRLGALPVHFELIRRGS
jgi:SecD/SecF fusion protein